MNFVQNQKSSIVKVYIYRYVHTYIYILYTLTDRDPEDANHETHETSDIDEEEVHDATTHKRSTKRPRSHSPDNDPNKRAKLGDPFRAEEGTTVYNDTKVEVKAKSIAHII